MEYKNTKLEFMVNIPQTFTLDTDPEKAKLYEKEMTGQDGKAYTSQSWMYFAKGNQIFFANKALHELLTGFKRGDTVSVTKMQMPGQRSFSWKVDTGQTGSETSRQSTNDYITNQNDIIERLTRMEKLLTAIYNEIRPKITVEKDNETPPAPTEDTNSFDKDLGF